MPTSDTTSNLLMPFVMQSQAQPNVTHNEALLMLDSVVQLAVLDKDLSSPPASPAAGDRYIVAVGASGAWTGKSGMVAAFVDDAWRFFQPRDGWRAWVTDESLLYVCDSGSWTVAAGAAGTALQNLELVGLGTEADTTNPLSAKVPNALFSARYAAEGGDGSLRLKLNKENAAATGSLLLQDGYSGRAEIGLLGDDDLRVKVSADGTSWLDALLIFRQTGAVSLPKNPKFAVSKATDQLVSAGTWTKIQHGTVQFDPLGCFNTTTNVFTAPHAGIYMLAAGFRFKKDVTAPTEICVGFSIDGATATGPYSDWTRPVDDRSSVEVARLMSLAAGQTIAIQTWFTGASGYVQGGQNYFWGFEVP